MNNKPESLYIHIPFCASICDYCDFTKLQYFSIFADKYIPALIDEIESFNINHKLKTIYIGGGTPSVFSYEQLETLLSYLDKYSLNIEEFTIEVNPESIDIEKLKLFKKHNVNRISMGVESTHDHILKKIGRVHTFKDVQEKVKLIREAGFNNLALDLILGLPNVSETLLKEDIKNIVSLNPETISLYSLTVHENTKFYLDGVKEKDEDIIRDMYDMCNDILSKDNYIHYEVSCWAKENKVSKHNLAYWTNKQYYGAGLGASGYVNQYRYKNIKNLIKYFDASSKVEVKEEVSLKDNKIYEIYLNLRTYFGLDLSIYQDKFKEDLMVTKKEEINDFIFKGLLIFDKKTNTLKTTYDGLMTLDNIVVSLI